MLLPKRNLVHLLQQIFRGALRRNEHKPSICRWLLRPNIVAFRIFRIMFQIPLSWHLTNDDGLRDGFPVFGHYLLPVDVLCAVNHRHRDDLLGVTIAETRHVRGDIVD